MEENSCFQKRPEIGVVSEIEVKSPDFENAWEAEEADAEEAEAEGDKKDSPTKGPYTFEFISVSKVLSGL